MPVTTSAKGALKKDQARTLINLKIKDRLKKTIKTFRQKPTAKNYALVSQILDRASKKKIIHKNKASRLKSRLSKLLSKKS
jgi:small subunit ribosomal protein S20